MLHRAIKFVHAAVLIFSAVLSFLFLRGLDEDGILGNSALVWVSDSDGSVSGAQVAQAVESFSADRGVTVAREVPDLMTPETRRHLYLASGGPQSDAGSWLHGGYPSFSKNVETEVHPITEIGQRDPRGFYYVFGSSTAADKFVAELAGLGLRASISHPFSFTELATAYSDSALAQSFGVVALAAVTMTGASVLLSAKAYGVLRLQGISFAGLLTRDLRQLAVFWLVAATGVVAAAYTFLSFYNGAAWLGLFASVAVGLAGLLVVLVLAAHAAVLALTCKVEVLRALKGEFPARATAISVYLVRVPALLLALSIAMDVSLAGQEVRARQESREAYVAAGDAVTIRLNGSLRGESDQVITHVGQWLREADGAGEVILAGRRSLQSIDQGSHLPPGEVLFVNETFLAKQSVLDTTGRRYTPISQVGQSGTRPVRLIIPESLADRASTITAAIRSKLSAGPGPPIPMETLEAKSGQDLFAYNSGNRSFSATRGPNDDGSLVRDPVIVAVPNGSEFLSDDTYTSFASQGGVIFPDPADVVDAIEADRSNELQTYVKAVRPVGKNSALELREAINGLRMQLFNLIVVVAVLLIAGIGVCIIYSRKNAQAIFVRHISGWRYTTTHRFVLAVELALAVLLATRMPFEAWVQNRQFEEFAAGGVPIPSPPIQITTLDFVIIAGLVTVELCAALLALAAFHGRIVKEGATAT